jgi:hypothetical protein
MAQLLTASVRVKLDVIEPGGSHPFRAPAGALPSQTFNKTYPREERMRLELVRYTGGLSQAGGGYILANHSCCRCPNRLKAREFGLPRTNLWNLEPKGLKICQSIIAHTPVQACEIG